MISAMAVVLTVAMSSFANAQEVNKDGNGNRVYGPYLTNRFDSNWFVGLGGGLNIGYNGKAETFSITNYGFGSNLNLYFGKWIVPTAGVRFGYEGLGTSTDRKLYDKVKFSFIHADFLLNFSNLVAGYKEKRTVNIVPFTQIGFVNSTKGNGVGVGLGFMVPIRLGNIVSIVPEVKGSFFNDNILGEVNNYGAMNASVKLGLMFNLGKSSWVRKSTFEKKLVGECENSKKALKEALNAANAASLKNKALSDSLKAANEKLAAENKKLKETKPQVIVKEDPKMKDMNKRMEEMAKELAALKTGKVETVDDGKGNKMIKVTLSNNILFAVGKSVLSPNAKTALANFAGKLESLPETDVVVYGHTDNTGSYEVNQRLSKQRASVVSSYLQQNGVSASRLSAEGMSYSQPVADNATAEGRALNRRVEIFISAGKNIKQAQKVAGK